MKWAVPGTPWLVCRQGVPGTCGSVLGIYSFKEEIYLNYKKYVRELIKSAWDVMPEKIRITDKEEYSAVVLQKFSGDYSLKFSIDHFRGLKRFCLPHVVFHEVSHVWDYWKHGRLAETIEQRRKDEIYADLCGVELLIDTGITFPILRSVLSTTFVAIQVYGFTDLLKSFFLWDKTKDLYPHPFVRSWYMWRHGRRYIKRKKRREEGKTQFITPDLFMQLRPAAFL